MPNDTERTPDDTQPTRRIPCEVYSRIVGYIRPVSAWNEGKRREFEDRVTFKQPEVGK